MEKILIIKDYVMKHIVVFIVAIITVLSVLGSITYVYLMSDKECPVCEDTVKPLSEEEAEPLETVKVDVKGAVKNPGVYELFLGSTIKDAIDTAGGTTSSAVTSNINLSKRLSDEMVVYVFTKTEIKEAESKNQIVCEIPKCECETISIDNGITGEIGNTENKKISINSATLEELMTLDGIGEAKAKAIIEYRTTNGPFERIEDLLEVSGIGDAMFENIKDKITV